MQIVYIRAHIGGKSRITGTIIVPYCDNIEIHQAQLDNHVQIDHHDHRDHHVHCAIIVPFR